MTYTCQHGTTHTAEEYFAAIAWAERAYPGWPLTLLTDCTGYVCWIQAWRERRS